jgi:adenine deaminase
LPNSMRVLDATVTRRSRGSGRIVGPEHRVDPITGLKALTLWSAYAHHEETLKGSLEPGKLADFAILSADPTIVAPTAIADIKVTETVKEGRTIFRLDPAKSKRASIGQPEISRLFASIGAAHEHDHDVAGSCPSEAMLKVAELMAGRAGAR